MVESIPLIPQQCETQGVDDYPNLSKAQKKKARAKYNKDKIVLKGCKDESIDESKAKNVFDDWQPPDFTQIKSQMHASLKEVEKNRERIMPKITLSDPKIIEIQNLLGTEEEIIRLDEEELIEVMKIVDGRKIPDWRN